MEKTTKKIMKPKYVKVQSDEFEEVAIYKTVDGMEFASIDDAQEHEIELRYGEDAPQVDFDMTSVGYTWYKARDQEELEYLTRRLSRGYKSLGASEMKIDEWFSIVYDYDPNGPDTATFISLSEFIKDFNELMSKLED